DRARACARPARCARRGATAVPGAARLRSSVRVAISQLELPAQDGHGIATDPSPRLAAFLADLDLHPARPAHLVSLREDQPARQLRRDEPLDERAQLSG